MPRNPSSRATRRPIARKAGWPPACACRQLVGARVFASLSRSLALSRSRRAQRERAILALAVRADGVGFLTAVEAVAHPPELGGSVAGPALGRRDEEIETAAGHVGNLGGAPRAIVEFGRAARQSTSVLICLGLAHAPSFLRAICSIPSFGTAKVAVNVCSPDTNKNTNKSDGWDRMGTNGDERRCTRNGLFLRFPSTARTVADALERALEQPSWWPLAETQLGTHSAATGAGTASVAPVTFLPRQEACRNQRYHGDNQGPHEVWPKPGKGGQHLGVRGRRHAPHGLHAALACRRYGYDLRDLVRQYYGEQSRTDGATLRAAPRSSRWSHARSS